MPLMRSIVALFSQVLLLSMVSSGQVRSAADDFESYSTAIMGNASQRAAHIKEATDLALLPLFLPGPTACQWMRHIPSTCAAIQLRCRDAALTTCCQGLSD